MSEKNLKLEKENKRKNEEGKEGREVKQAPARQRPSKVTRKEIRG